MAADHGQRYVWVITWDESVVRPPVSVWHELTLQPGAQPEEFERLMRDTILPLTGRVVTRAGGIAEQQLFKEASTGIPGRFLDLEADAEQALDTLVTAAAQRRFRQVLRWPPGPVAPPRRAARQLIQHKKGPYLTTAEVAALVGTGGMYSRGPGCRG